MTLTEFLLARIAEDEAVAHAWPHDVKGVAPDGRPWRDTSGHSIWAPKTRVLAECDAKRKIVQMHLDGIAADDWDMRATTPVVQILASIYRDHPDFDPEWLL